MKLTMYNTPVIRPLIKASCAIILKLRGWKLEGKMPSEPKYVLIGVPHTSNWDLPITLAMAFLFGFDTHWMGKDTLFKSWRGPIMKWLGGIPINRNCKNNMVAQTIKAFNNSDRLVITVPPEGSRSRVDKWKTGFYYIAMGAKVPIALAFLDYRRKAGGFLSTFYPTGDVTADIKKIRSRYVGICGKYAGKCTVE